MALHINRDYLVQSPSGTRSPSSYVLSIFLRRVLGFSFVGQTNYNINSTTAATTIASGSNSVALPNATVNVVSTAGFPTSGNICVQTSNGAQYVTYTGVTSTSFTGCALGSGTMSTGGAVTMMLVATGDSTPTASPTFAAGTMAGINNGTGALHVTIPAAVRTVIAADVGRILVLKSTANPRFNSGCFLITGIDTTSGRNDYLINWRSGDSPPSEAVDTMQWWLYAADVAAPVVQNAGVNGGTGYRSNGAASVARMVLQSPHSTGWQVRICHESSVDTNTNVTCPLVSTTVGFDGTAAGDFLVGGRHCHTALWNDTANSKFGGLTPGTADISANTYRLTIMADDSGLAVAMFGRDAASTGHWMIAFGIPESETLPVPTDPLYRLFSLGNRLNVNNGLTFSNVSLSSTGSINAGSAYGYQNQPISCTTGCWAFASGPGQGGTPFADATAGDSPFIGVTELVTVNIVAGSLHSYNSSVNSNVIPQEPRVLGIFPYLRQGRTNFGTHTLSTDLAWQHMRNGVYMPWGGPAILP